MTDYEALSKHVIDLLIENSIMGETLKEQAIKIATYENSFNRILILLETNNRVPKSLRNDIISIINNV